MKQVCASIVACIVLLAAGGCGCSLSGTGFTKPEHTPLLQGHADVVGTHDFYVCGILSIETRIAYKTDDGAPVTKRDVEFVCRQWRPQFKQIIAPRLTPAAEKSASRLRRARENPFSYHYAPFAKTSYSPYTVVLVSLDPHVIVVAEHPRLIPTRNHRNSDHFLAPNYGADGGEPTPVGQRDNLNSYIMFPYSISPGRIVPQSEVVQVFVYHQRRSWTPAQVEQDAAGTIRVLDNGMELLRLVPETDEWLIAVP